MPPISPQSRLSDGVWRIAGSGRDIGITIRDQSVRSFTDSMAGDSVSLDADTILASRIVECTPSRVALSWTLRDLAVNGSEAIRHEYRFEGTPDGHDMFRGTLSVKIVAGFLRPTVILADTQVDAVMSRHAALNAIPAA